MVDRHDPRAGPDVDTRRRERRRVDQVELVTLRVAHRELGDHHPVVRVAPLRADHGQRDLAARDGGEQLLGEAGADGAEADEDDAERGRVGHGTQIRCPASERRGIDVDEDGHDHEGDVGADEAVEGGGVAAGRLLRDVQHLRDEEAAVGADRRDETERRGGLALHLSRPPECPGARRSRCRAPRRCSGSSGRSSRCRRRWRRTARGSSRGTPRSSGSTWSG